MLVRITYLVNVLQIVWVGKWDGSAHLNLHNTGERGIQNDGCILYS